MADQTLSPEAKALRVKELNKARQQKFYSLNQEKVKENRRARYKTQTDALKIVQQNALIQPPGPKADDDAKWPKPYDDTKSYKTYEDILEKFNDIDKKNYSSHLKTLFRILNTKNYVTAIATARTVINKINNARHGTASDLPYKTNSKKSIVQAIVRTVTQLNIPISVNQFQTYLLEFETLKLDSIDENLKKQEEEPTILFPEYLTKVKEHFGKEGKEFVMASLYDELTLRDDFHLKIVETVKEAEKDKEQQYLIVPASGTAQLTIVINKYKTEKRYGPIKEQLTTGLSTLMRKYIVSEDLAYGDYLFGDKDNNGTFVSKMNKDMGLTGSITQYRHMKASELKYTLNNRDRVKLAARMKHSPLINLRYIRKLKAADFPEDEPEVVEPAKVKKKK